MASTAWPCAAFFSGDTRSARPLTGLSIPSRGESRHYRPCTAFGREANLRWLVPRCLFHTGYFSRAKLMKNAVFVLDMHDPLVYLAKDGSVNP